MLGTLNGYKLKKLKIITVNNGHEFAGRQVQPISNTIANLVARIPNKGK